MRLCTIASSSSGNCTYIGTESTHILIDVGITMKRVREGLSRLGLDLSDIDGIFVTHEHDDHIKGLPVVERNYGIDLYATAGTREGILQCKKRQTVDEGLFKNIVSGEAVAIGDLVVTPFSIHHDVREPVGFVADDGRHRMAVMTDTGHFDDEMVEALHGLDALVLESNHDVRMLQTGPYPYPLKVRIAGENGHLSNDAAGAFLSRILHDGFGEVILGHLSDHNNLPELAYETVRMGVEFGDCPYGGDDFPISVAPKDALSKIIEM